MQMTLPEEREFTLAEAERRALQDIGALGLTPRCQSLGTGPCAAWTELHDAHGQLVTGGWGKGEMQAARTGALYEALEHLLTRRHAADQATVLAVDDLIARMPPEAIACLPGALLADQVEETIACRRYENLHDGPDFDYPLALSAPDYVDAPLRDDSFDYTGLRRYASNSGTAIGASVDEALLHALNECIERDAMSLFLLRHFFHARQAPLHVVSCDGLPADTADLYRRVSHLVDADITLLDISNGPGVTTCLAVSHRLYPHTRPYGAGASLNPAHAARRALSELVQSHLGLSCDADALLDARKEAPDLWARLQPWPRLQACLAMDVEQRLATQLLVPATLAEVPAGDVHSQVRQIAAVLGAHGLQAGFAVVHQTALGTALVNVVVPTFERFHLVVIGNVVVPGQRGQALVP
ncbi:YcaO-like family protein [Stenotrophomonas tumulicola]